MYRILLVVRLSICLASLARPISANPNDTAGEQPTVDRLDPRPFGQPGLDLGATGDWGSYIKTKQAPNYVRYMGLDVPRDKVVAFGLYTHDAGVLKLTAQLYPLKSGESNVARLEFDFGDGWKEAARAAVVYPGWSAHFRVKDWDNTKTVPYRVCHGEQATFEGVIRRDPVDKDEIVVGVMSCNGSHDVRNNPHVKTVANLKKLDPDVLFFVGDQHYRHTEHTAGWLDFGRDFCDVLRDRPVVAIPDDHDVGHGNLWGEGGAVSKKSSGDDGGYKYPAAYVNMVQRQQSWHLPDPWDPTPVKQGITVYYTRLRVGGVDFAILEDRKFKTGPDGEVPKRGGRVDHISTKHGPFDPKSVDLPHLKLLGDRQLKFLRAWGEDWSGAQIKAAVSQTAFCGAVHIHGTPDNYMLADLDCNGWPQSGRDKALRELRKVQATHLCGDQHLAVVVKQGIEKDADGPYALTSPALWNSIYHRWWKPQDGKPGADPIPDSPLPFTGNYRDGLGNRIRMLAYANAAFERRLPEENLAAGFGIARFDKKSRTVTFEVWPSYADIDQGRKAMFPGWPVTGKLDDNDGRDPNGYWLPEQTFEIENPVVQVISEKDGEVLYTRRIQGNRFRPPVYKAGSYTLKVGKDRPESVVLKNHEVKRSLKGKEGDTPQFHAQTLDGRRITAEDLKGRIAVIHFWSTRCKGCQSSIEPLKQAHADFAGDDVVFLGVSGDLTEETCRDSVLKKGMTWTHTLEKKSNLVQAFGVGMYPAAFILDESGTIVRSIHPASIEESLQKAIQDSKKDST
jgi:peroxiredoxin